MREPLFFGLIPARSGSKGLPGKNIKDLSGHPLLSYSIQASRDSKQITRTLVSTDAQDIAEIAKRYGAEVPFLRPESLAQDFSLDHEFLLHAYEELKKNGDQTPDYFVLLRPTSPVRELHLVDNAIEHFLKANAQGGLDSLRSVVRCPQTPYKMWFKEGDRLRPLLPAPEGIEEPYNAPRQNLPVAYLQAGAIDIISIETVLSGSASGSKIGYYELEPETYCDIDSLTDFQRAEGLLQSGLFIKPRAVDLLELERLSPPYA